MWIGVALTVVVELVPKALRTSVVAFYLFIISIIGGNMPLAVPPLKETTGSLRVALYILYPGLYLLSSVLFLFTLFVLKWDAARAKVIESNMEKDASPLLKDSSDDYESSTQKV